MKKTPFLLLTSTLIGLCLSSCATAPVSERAEEPVKVRTAVKGISRHKDDTPVDRAKKVVFSGLGIQNNGEKTFLGGMLTW